MKRSYDDMNSELTILPKASDDDPKLYKATWEGTHRLLVTKVLDISKPTEKPAEEIEPDENEEDNKQNKSNTRMLQLCLKDLNGTEIKAIETEFIDSLTSVTANHIVNLAGPLDVRCGNMILTKKNVTYVKKDNTHHPMKEPQRDIVEAEKEKQQDSFREPKEVALQEVAQQSGMEEDVFSDDEPTQLYKVPKKAVTPPLPEVMEVKQEVVHIEDWDEDDEEDDDCIIIE